jgi:hypothetical protein
MEEPHTHRHAGRKRGREEGGGGAVPAQAGAALPNPIPSKSKAAEATPVLRPSNWREERGRAAQSGEWGCSLSAAAHVRAPLPSPIQPDWVFGSGCVVCKRGGRGVPKKAPKGGGGFVEEDQTGRRREGGIQQADCPAGASCWATRGGGGGGGGGLICISRAKVGRGVEGRSRTKVVARTRGLFFLEAGVEGGGAQQRSHAAAAKRKKGALTTKRNRGAP